MSDSQLLFPGFMPFDIDVGGFSLRGVKGGDGPPLMLLHGYPQTHVMWHKVAGPLSQHFTIVAPDLPGYGDSGNPPTDEYHTPYSKRAMGECMMKLMQHFGYETFQLAGHDRGGRVAHRMCVDFPDAVDRCAVLDIAPTREMYANTGDAFARAYWHWFFLILPAPIPETMIQADVDMFMRRKCSYAQYKDTVFTEAAWESYLTAFQRPENIHSACEDYRAAASIDIAHDNDDDESGRGVRCPLLVLWGEHGVIESCFDPIALWQQRALNVSGGAIPGGHYLAEERPDNIVSAFTDFFAH